MADDLNDLRAEAVGAALFDGVEQLEPGQLFGVTWAFRNDGEQEWTDEFRLVYSDEQQPETADYPHTNLAGGDSYALSELGSGRTIVPGDTAYLSLSLTAPETPGTYLTGWQLQSAGGQRFGPVRELRAVVIEPETKGLGELTYQVVGFQNSEASYNQMQAGQSFSGSWTLKNTSIDNWSGDFRLVYQAEGPVDTADAKSELMGTQATYGLGELIGKEQVTPGETVVIRLNFTAPQQPGFYSYHWQLVNAQGQPFGGLRWMRIGVVQAASTAPPRPVETVSTAYGGPAVRFFTGIHGPADDYMWSNPTFQEMMRRLNMPVFFWSPGQNKDFAHFGDPARNAVRLYWNPEPVSADRAYETIRDDQLRHWWERGYRRFVFFNEPQFGIEIAKIEEGFGISWRSPEEFGRFLKQCLARARADFPGIRLYTTPMSSNEAFAPWNWYRAMWAEVRGLVDGWCMHAYSGDNGNAEAAAQNIANQVVEVQRTFRLQIPVIISEASVNRGSDAEQKARVAHLLHRKLSQVSGVEGVFWYAADWNPEYDNHKEGWFRNGIADAYLRQAA
jgi:hypothetical protein